MSSQLCPISCLTLKVDCENGLRGMPAGMTKMSAPVRAFLRPSSLGRKPSILAMEEMWERSAVTPGVLTTS